MRPTPLFAAALLLVVAAPPASAFCATVLGCVNGNEVTELTDEATGTAIAVVGLVIGLAEEQVHDADADNFPDEGEGAICGNDLLFQLVNQPTVPGQCLTGTDYLPPDDLQGALQTVGFLVGTGIGTAELLAGQAEALAAEVQGIAEGVVSDAQQRVDELYAAVDGDGDGVADLLEAPICAFVENGNFPQDGSCDAANTDYTPPV